MRTRAEDLSSQGKSEDVVFIPSSLQSLPLGLKVHFGVSAPPPAPPSPRASSPPSSALQASGTARGPRTHAYGAVVFTAASSGQNDTSTCATKRPKRKVPAGVKCGRCKRFLHLPKKPFFFLDYGVLFSLYFFLPDSLLSKLCFQGLSM